MTPCKGKLKYESVLNSKLGKLHDAIIGYVSNYWMSGIIEHPGGRYIKSQQLVITPMNSYSYNTSEWHLHNNIWWAS